MKDINVFTVSGRLVRDGELKYTNRGTAVLEFSIAVNRSKNVNGQWIEEASFFDMALFDKRAEGLAQYLKKGQQVFVRGTLKQDRWQDQQTGTNRSRVGFTVDDILLAGQRSTETAQNVPTPQRDAHRRIAAQYPAPGGYPQANQQEKSSQGPPEFDDMQFDDDIPF